MVTDIYIHQFGLPYTYLLMLLLCLQLLQMNEVFLSHRLLLQHLVPLFELFNGFLARLYMVTGLHTLLSLEHKAIVNR